MILRFWLALSMGLVLSLSLLSPSLATAIDSTDFMKSLIGGELRKGEKNCRKKMRKTAKCKISIQKVLISKETRDTAHIDVVSNLKISTKFLVKAAAYARVHAKLSYQIRTCTINVLKVTQTITKLSGAAKYLGPFKSRISKIKVPTGEQPIKDNKIRNRFDNYLVRYLKLASKRKAPDCKK